MDLSKKFKNVITELDPVIYIIELKIPIRDIKR